jgi:hypothetical protein
MVFQISGDSIRPSNIMIQDINPTMVSGTLRKTALQNLQEAYEKKDLSALDTLKNAKMNATPSYTILDVLQRTASQNRDRIQSQIQMPNAVSGRASDTSNGLYRQQVANRNAKLVVGNAIIDRARVPQIVPSDYSVLLKNQRY